MKRLAEEKALEVAGETGEPMDPEEILDPDKAKSVDE